MDAAAEAGSALSTASNSQDVIVIRKPKKKKSAKNSNIKKRFTLTEIRAIIQIYNFMFRRRLVNGRRETMDGDQRDRRYAAYADRMLRDFRREVPKEWKSEQAWIRRYSDPMTFLKYKLGAENYKYYLEIGGEPISR